MKIVLINSVNFGSTGKIMMDIAHAARKNGNTVYTACANSRSNKSNNTDNQLFVGNTLGRNLHLILARLTGYNGCFSHISTYCFMKKLDKLKPDILHLHNLHNCYINLPMLFRYIKKKKIRIIWTLHDCWAFTGQCPHFQIVKCDRWKNGCHDCPQYRQYPASRLDRTGIMYKLKKKWFTGVENMTIVTPSEWLAGLVKQSFLKDYDVQVINNGIDLEIFKPTASDLREKLGLIDKTALLGCASPWSRRKGLDVFVSLAQRLDDNYKIILMGVSKGQKDALPYGILGIERTADQRELAQYYTMADIFVNPTREEVLGLVNIEALACGTPVITFNSGGSPECVDESCGVVVNNKDCDGIILAIKDIESNKIRAENCIYRAERFEKNKKCGEYVKLYEKCR